MSLRLNLTTREKYLFAGAFAFFILWAFYLVTAYADFFKNNTLVGTFLFTSLYVTFIYGYYLDEGIHVSLAARSTEDRIRIIAGFILIFVAFDIIAYPSMIPIAGPIQGLATVQQLSSDYVIYNALPSYLPHLSKYAITYVVAPWLSIFAARMLLAKKVFWEIAKISL